jgi:hypothetical protein
MQIKKVKIETIKPNDNNPRVIKNEKFNKLVKSIKEFPEMLEVRPIVVDENNIVLGGNMRLRACKEAGLKEVFIINFNDLSEDKKNEFIIKDNVGFGDWDFDMLKTEWEQEYLTEWGLDITFGNEDYFNVDGDSTGSDSGDKPSPRASDDEYTLYEIILMYDNKIRLLQVLNEIKLEHNLEKQEDAIMTLVNFYKENKK